MPNDLPFLLVDLVPFVGLGGEALVVRHHDDALAVFMRERLENRDHLIRRVHIEIAGRLVGDQDLAARRECPRDCDVLLLAARKHGRAQPGLFAANLDRIQKPYDRRAAAIHLVVRNV